MSPDSIKRKNVTMNSRELTQKMQKYLQKLFSFSFKMILHRLRMNVVTRLHKQVESPENRNVVTLLKSDSKVMFSSKCALTFKNAFLQNLQNVETLSSFSSYVKKALSSSIRWWAIGKNRSKNMTRLPNLNIWFANFTFCVKTTGFSSSTL